MSEDDQRETLKGWLIEAVTLRGELLQGEDGLAPYSDLVSPFQIVEQLTYVRRTLDRLEELLVKAIRAKAQLARGHRIKKDQLQQAWDTHVSDQSPTRRRVLTQEYVTGKEKFAEANLATLELQRTERKSLELLSFAEETLEVIKVIHRGLNDIRQDLLAQVRAIQVESQLER